MVPMFVALKWTGSAWFRAWRTHLVADLQPWLVAHGSLVVKQICHHTLWFACCRFNDLSMWVVFICFNDFNGNDPRNFGSSLSSLHESWTWQALPMRHHETEELWVGDTKKRSWESWDAWWGFSWRALICWPEPTDPKIFRVLSSCSALKTAVVQLGNHLCSDQFLQVCPGRSRLWCQFLIIGMWRLRGFRKAFPLGRFRKSILFFDSPHQRVRTIYWNLLIYSWSVFSKKDLLFAWISVHDMKSQCNRI